MDDREEEKEKPSYNAFRAERAWAAIRDLPQSHRLPAFLATLVSIIVCTLIGSLIAQDGAEFATSTPIIGFSVFAMVSLAVLYSLPRSKFAGYLVGLFYLLPILYAFVVISLALVNRTTAESLSLVSPLEGSNILGSVNVQWEPSQPVLVQVRKEDQLIASSERYVLPPYRVELPSGNGYELSISGRLGGSRSASFDVDPDPRNTSLSSVYRPPYKNLEKDQNLYLEGTLIIPKDFSISSTLSISGLDPIKLLGVADNFGEACGLRMPRGNDMCSYRFVYVPIEPGSGRSISLDGVIIDRNGIKHFVEERLTVSFEEIYSTISITVNYDGTVELYAVPG